MDDGANAYRLILGVIEDIVNNDFLSNENAKTREICEIPIVVSAGTNRQDKER